MTEPLKPLRYAKVGGPPHDWLGLLVLDAVTGETVQEVVEVDCDEGWLIRLAKDADGKYIHDGDRVATERIGGQFLIVRR